MHIPDERGAVHSSDDALAVPTGARALLLVDNNDLYGLLNNDREGRGDGEGVHVSRWW